MFQDEIFPKLDREFRGQVMSVSDLARDQILYLTFAFDWKLETLTLTRYQVKKVNYLDPACEHPRGLHGFIFTGRKKQRKELLLSQLSLDGSRGKLGRLFRDWTGARDYAIYLRLSSMVRNLDLT